ncbi:manganese efflux pump MntP family protein [Gallaecimonas pentaromativorans]|uniref:manganese efflux pump MntP n=1 Tax=Gallaecimonas pentaromativorans TaxID=584787 RepID=UPI00067EA057|nr:manganese efflux pump MntP family protein [Gallaecimonas pentaromativorans]MED5523697.1 manganese efflux pump MntP family protein [Pseudomonadota bacterium]
MSFVSLLFIAFAMSTDAFAVAVARGATLKHPHFGRAFRTGVLFGSVEAISPLIGWLIGIGAASYIVKWDHWLAFGLLLALGLKMIHEGLQKPEEGEEADDKAKRSRVMMLLTAVATSIDAMAIGLGFAFIDVNIFEASLLIGLATLTMVTFGIMLGQRLGAMIGKRAELLGGLVLIVVGSVILREHLLGLA